jgi:hypothetical protein
MKTLMTITIALAISVATLHAETTKGGWFFALTKENAHKATVAVGEPDAKAVFDQMHAAGMIYPMKGGLDITVLSIEGGLVKFRLRGSIVEMWTCIEAINR